ncbi:MAG TPA: hypothetical protein PKC30_10310 [Saprospiraceae bacterium]|nr:hypothetical protein [Saprospiraceae bacterium]
MSPTINQTFNIKNILWVLLIAIQDLIYIHRIASTYAVKRNGRVTQNHSGKNMRKARQAIKEPKNTNQYIRILSEEDLAIKHCLL